jgi:hypothetical protein
MIYIQKCVRGFLARTKYLRELRAMLAETGQQDLLMTNDEIERRDKGRFIFKHMYAYWQCKKRNRIRQAATLKIQTYYRMWFVKNSSFVQALEIDRYPKLYFLKEQKP